ncbi:MAG: aminomethyltransferase beta-barrel domain-containing protein, partial [Thermoleophilia bacterium]
GINLFQHREEIVECLAQVRYNSPPIPARVAWEGDIATVDLSQPAYGVAPGQSTVLYRDDIVIGGGVIVKSG